MSTTDPLVFGHIDGYPVGSLFKDRDALSAARVHGPPMAGIWGRQAEGACSIVMSGGYEDDVDELDYVMYTGHGGQDRPGGTQVRDQDFVDSNKALQVTYENGLPLRVTRGHQIPNGPEEEKGYRYDGLYYAALLCFALPLSAILFTGASMIDVEGTPELVGTFLGGSLVTMMAGITGFFAGLILLVIGLLIGREKTVVVVKEGSRKTPTL